MFRIRSNDVLRMQKGKAPAVLLQHGLVSSSETWILNTVEKAPAFVFANAGYDVWLGNNRGNCYSRRHETLDVDKDFQEFFDYSYTDLGRHDLPAEVAFVCEQS
jgi:pimeloyl-ACP methyl ester carboxylesterase